MKANSDVVIIGGGIAGITTAYFLGKLGVKSTVIEKDNIGAHASGLAYGGIGAVSGIIPEEPTSQIVSEGARLHKEFAECLPQQTGINFDFRERPSLLLAFTDDEATEAKKRIKGHPQAGSLVKWLDRHEAKSIESRISPATIGAVYRSHGAEVEPYRLILALAQAAEGMGANISYGDVTSIITRNGKVMSVRLADDEITCQHVVIAMGPWSGHASKWLNISIPVRPLKGQILRLRVAGEPYHCSIGWQSNYAGTKGDGLVWTGSTEEDVGFDQNPTSKARQEIMRSATKMIPSLKDSQVIMQTACLRPMTPDKLLLLGRAPNYDGVYIASGGGRSGISMGPAMGQITADLIHKGKTNIPITAFDPGRFDLP